MLVYSNIIQLLVMIADPSNKPLDSEVSAQLHIQS